MTDTQPIIEAAERAAQPAKLDPNGRFWLSHEQDGYHPHITDLEQLREQFAEYPRRKKGAYTAHDAASFAAYVDKHGTETSEVWADVRAASVTAVLNANQPDAEGNGDGAMWEDHRITYAVLLTPAWKAWTEKDGQLLSQQQFAEHIENRAIDVVTPSGAEMLELAQTFQATIGVQFESSQQLSSGERQLQYRETVDAKAGRTGRLEIPQDFTLALIPFEGAKAYGVKARLRYRIADGNLRLGYSLERPEDVLREAFSDVVAEIRDLIDPPVFMGEVRR